MHRISSYLLMAVASLISLNPNLVFAEGDTFSFGSACISQGAWTQSALLQTREITAIAEKLKNDPNCKGIESVVSAMASAQAAMSVAPNQEETASRMESIPGEVKALRAFMGSSPAAKKSILTQALFDRTVESASLATDAAGSAISQITPNGQIIKAIGSLLGRTQRAATTGIEMADQVFKILPSYDRCLVKNPKQGAALFAASIRLAGSFASSDENIINRLSGSIANLVAMARDRQFSKVLREMDKTQLWMSISCLLETSAQNYCSAKDAMELLKYNADTEKLVRQGSLAGENPMSGYLLLVREIPIVSHWLQQLQFGTRPKLISDGEYKNRISDDFNKFIARVNIIQGTYSENLTTLAILKDKSAQQNFVLKMIATITSAMGGGDAEPEGYAGDHQNFFTQNIQSISIPFYLIGYEKNQVPNEVIPGASNRMPMSWQVYMMKGNGDNFLSQFNDPIALANNVGARMNQLIDEANVGASAYFMQRLVVDIRNLAAEAENGQQITVVQSLLNIHQYLKALKARLLTNFGGPTIAQSVDDTINRIAKVLVAFRELRAASKNALTNAKGPISPETDKKLSDLAVETVETAYREFNVLLQRDTFLANRINTAVKADYAMRVKGKQDMTQSQQEIFLLSGKDLLDRLMDVHRIRVTDVEKDLNTAQLINKRNLVALEQIFSTNLLEAIHEIGRTADPSTSTPWERFMEYNVPKIGAAARNYGARVMWGSLALPLAKRLGIWKPAEGGISLRYGPRSDDEFGSAAQVKAKFCLQALAFEDRTKFFNECKGTILTTLFDSPEVYERMNYHINTAYWSYDNESTYKAPTDSRRICAFRDFGRKSLVYWLTKSYDSSTISDVDLDKALENL